MKIKTVPIGKTLVAELGEISLGLAGFVFEALGKNPFETVTEFSLKPEEMPVDSYDDELHRFRNGEFFYEIAQHFRHQDNSVGAEHYSVNFEARISDRTAALVRVRAGGYAHNGTYGYWDSVFCALLVIEFEETRADFVENLVQKMTEKLDQD